MKVAAIWALVLLAFLFFVPSSIKAQTHPCGAGPGPNEVQVGVEPGGNGVAPTPMCDWVNNNQQQPPPPQPPKWASRWGAIANSFTHSTFRSGAGFNQPSREAAEQAAIENCQSNGGTQCKVEIAYHDQCVAMISGDTGHNSGSAATTDQAIQLGMKTCTDAGDTNCHVVYTSCSLPVRIQ